MEDWAEEDVRREAKSRELRRIVELNQRYEVNDYHGEVGEGRNFEVFRGEIPVIASAPHAVKQWRNEKVKNRDALTGGIVEYLAERFEVYGITRIWDAKDDPNFGDDEWSRGYRAKVREMVTEVGAKIVFDVHGCRNRYGFDIDIGINGGRNLACERGVIEKMAEIWRREGLDVRIDERFTAERLNTVSNQVHRMTGVSCLQIELSEDVRKGDEKIRKFLKGFGEVLSLAGIEFGRA